MLIFRYSDADVYENRLQTGYRLTLVYNIVHDGTGIPLSAAHMDDAQQDLNDVLGEWEEKRTSHPTLAPENLVHLFEQPLGCSGLCLDSLRGQDYLKARHLMTACQTRGFCFFLGTMEYTVTRYLCDDNDEHHCRCCLNYAKEIHMWDDCEKRSCKLSVIVTANGQPIAENIRIDELSVVQDPVVGPNVEPDEYRLAARSKRHPFLSYNDSGNHPDQRGLVQVYNRCSVVLIPRASRIDFLLNGKGPNKLEFDVLFDILLQEIEDEQLSKRSKEELKALRRRMVASRSCMNEDQVKKFIVACEAVIISALRLGDTDLFEDTLRRPDAEMLPLAVFGSIGRSMAELDLEIWQRRFVSVAFVDVELG